MPCFSSSVIQPSNAPGTVMVSMPVDRHLLVTERGTRAAVSARGARPLAFSASSFFVFAE